MANYIPPEIWAWDKESGGEFADINRPVAGKTHEKILPVGEHPLQLYSLATPNGVKATIMLEELLALGNKGAEYDAHLIKINGEQFSSGFVSLNPNSKIPVLLDNSTNPSTRIFESGAILIYLAEKFGVLYPPELSARAECLSWLMWQMGGLGPMFGQLLVFAAAFENSIPAATDRYGKETRRLLSVLNTRLEGRDFLASNYSIADIASMAWMPMVEKVGWEMADWPNVNAWYDRCMSRPAYAKAVEAAGTLPDEVRMANFRKGTVGLGS